jgi:hypothetical protein
MRPEHFYTIIGTVLGIFLLGVVICYGDEIKNRWKKIWK